MRLLRCLRSSHECEDALEIKLRSKAIHSLSGNGKKDFDSKNSSEAPFE